MLAQAEYPQTLQSEELDYYLAQGWFRMGQTIFTTNFLNFKNQLYSAIWLRLVLDKMPVNNKTKQKWQRLNSVFRTEIGRACLTPEKEALFANYKQGVSFNPSPTLQALMYGKVAYNIYDTYEICVYDKDKLIAAGFFDIGKHSAAGITSFYDQAYKKHSLGKYMIFMKIEYCIKKGLQYFYPGYFVPGYSIFDYKLDIGKPALEYCELDSQQWLAITNFSASHTPLQIMRRKLLQLQKCLLEFEIKSKVLIFEFFDAKLIPDLHGIDVLDSPLFLVFSEVEENILSPVIIYDVRDQCYRVIKCRSLVNLSAPSVDGFYSSHLLKVEEEVFFTKDVEKVLSMILKEKPRTNFHNL